MTSALLLAHSDLFSENLFLSVAALVPLLRVIRAQELLAERRGTPPR